MSISIKLAWNNPNAVSSVTNIYRSTSAIDRTNLGTPYQTLSAGQQAYEDTAVTYGTLYYYVFESVNGSDKAVSKQFSFWALPYSGPGPQALILGDTEYGYYGTLTASDFFNSDQLLVLCGLGAYAGNATAPVWHKYSYLGKTVYVPESSITSLSQVTYWNDIYNAGCMYGIDGVGPVPLGAGVNQNKLITLGQDTFRVRTPTGFNNTSNGRLIAAPASTQIDASYTGTDFDLFLQPLSGYFFSDYKLPRPRPLPYGDFFNTTLPYVILQDTAYNADTSFARRGLGSKTAIGIGSVTSKAGASGSRWYPVLEWVPAS